MDDYSIAAIVDFEVYLLVAMKTRIKMSRKESQLEAKLSEHGFSVTDAEYTHARIADVLGNESLYFENMKRLLGLTNQEVTELVYKSVLWPNFEFRAASNSNGHIESARYRHLLRSSRKVASPVELAMWSVDAIEFAEQFGPLTNRRSWPTTDAYLAGYEEYEFSWNGETYGAGFSWGLFMFAAMSWE